MEYSSGEILLYNQEIIQYYNPQVTFITQQSSNQLTHLGLGEMFITTQRVHWKNADLEISKPYQQFGLHAISRDMNNFPAPCLYCQLYCEELAEGEEPTHWISVTLNLVQTMFDVFTECSAMNPGPESAELVTDLIEDLEDMEMEQDTEAMDTDN